MSPKYVEYTSPPIIEVVFGVMFEEEVLSTAHLGAFWNEVRPQFPYVRDRQPLHHAIEGGAPTPDLAAMELPPARRIWIWSDEHDWLIQMQPDRFIVNWKRDPSAKPYLSFVELYGWFKEYLRRFEEHANATLDQPLAHEQYELTYVNEIDATSGLADFDVFSVMRDHMRDDTTSRHLGRPVAFKWTDAYPLDRGNGMLRITGQCQNVDQEEMRVRLDLAAKGLPTAETQSSGDEVMDVWFDTAHKAIVLGFGDVTNSTLQTEKWGLQS